MGARLTLSSTALPGVLRVDSTRLEDTRGSFLRLFCEYELATLLAPRHAVQVNLSETRRRGAVRGMHWQRHPHGEMKLVRCLRGEAWDVAVDLRRDSPTFLRWHAERLSASNARALLIPEGFAHGFQALCDDVQMLYCHTEPYWPEAEAGLHPQDPRLAIDWPLPVTDLSPRDAARTLLGEGFAGEPA